MPNPTSIRRSAIFSVVIFSAMLIVSPFDASAGENRWPRRSDKLPGLSSPTPIIVAGSVLLAVLLIARVNTDKQKDEDKEKKKEDDQDKTARTDSSGFACLDCPRPVHTATPGLLKELSRTRAHPLSLYLTLSNGGPGDLHIGRATLAITSQTLALGVAFSF